MKKRIIEKNIKMKLNLENQVNIMKKNLITIIEKIVQLIQIKQIIKYYLL